MLIAFALFFVVRMVGQVAERGALLEEIEYYEDQLAAAEADYEEQISLQELMHNDSYIERVAREKLGMVKVGETVVSMVNVENDEDNDFQADSSPSNYDVDSNPE